MSETVNGMYKRAEVTRPPKPLHCLRHTFGTVMARKVPLPVLRDLMGHADIATTMRYIDVGEADKRERTIRFRDHPQTPPWQLVERRFEAW